MTNINQHNNLCAVIPAAGKSSRMKTPKPLLRFDKKKTFIEKIIDEFNMFGCNKIIVVINKTIYNSKTWNEILPHLIKIKADTRY